MASAAINRSTASQGACRRSYSGGSGSGLSVEQPGSPWLKLLDLDLRTEAAKSSLYSCEGL